MPFQGVGAFDHKGWAFEHHQQGDEDLSNWTFKMSNAQDVELVGGIEDFENWIDWYIEANSKGTTGDCKGPGMMIYLPNRQ